MRPVLNVCSPRRSFGRYRFHLSFSRSTSTAGSERNLGQRLTRAHWQNESLRSSIERLLLAKGHQRRIVVGVYYYHRQTLELARSGLGK